MSGILPSDSLFHSHRAAVLKLSDYTCEAWAELIVTRAESQPGRSFRYPLMLDLDVRVKFTVLDLPGSWDYPQYVVIPYLPKTTRPMDSAT